MTDAGYGRAIRGPGPIEISQPVSAGRQGGRTPQAEGPGENSGARQGFHFHPAGGCQPSKRRPADADEEPPGLYRSARDRHLLSGLPSEMARDPQRRAAHPGTNRLCRRSDRTMAGRAGYSAAELRPKRTLLNIVWKKVLHLTFGQLY